MWRHPAMLAPVRGFVTPYCRAERVSESGQTFFRAGTERRERRGKDGGKLTLARRFISPGISFSASSISFRPQAASVI